MKPGALLHLQHPSPALTDRPWASSKNPTIHNLLRYALALKLDIGKVLSECLEPHLREEPLKKKPKK